MNERTANIEWHCEHCGTVRIINGQFGRKYVWQTTIIRDGTTAKFAGAMWFDMRFLAPLRVALKAEGFTRLLFTRFDKGLQEREIEVRV